MPSAGSTTQYMRSDFDTAVAELRKHGIKPCGTSRCKKDCTPERWAAHLEYLVLRRKREKEKIKVYNRAYKIRSRYGISPEQYDAALEACNYTCQICGERCRKRLSVDHCHETGENRGLLCQNCNTAIGMFQNSEFKLENALEYIRSWSKSHVAELLRREDLDDTAKRN